jgi:hypothetical protein
MTTPSLALPTNLSSCINMTKMILRDNKHIPSELSEKPMSLAVMSLRNYSFTGPIPASLANLSHLENLRSTARRRSTDRSPCQPSDWLPSVCWIQISGPLPCLHQQKRPGHPIFLATTTTESPCNTDPTQNRRRPSKSIAGSPRAARSIFALRSQRRTSRSIDALPSQYLAS